MSAATLLALAAAGAALTTPAGASLTGPDSVRPGKNITVFHNSDFVAAFGYPVGQELTVDVYRGPHRIATAFGPAVNTPEGGGLEVNHGPAGAAVQGDCWEDYTPDILPGDEIRVTDSADVTDSVIVDNITISGGPIDTDPTNPFAPVVLEGRASFLDGTPGGTPIPEIQLNSGELRHDGPRFRAVPNRVERILGTTDGWRATYQWPYVITQQKESMTPQQKKDAVLNGDHAMGFGHVVPLPVDTQIAEFPAPGGPALDCGNPNSPHYAPKQANAITTSDDKFVNLDSGSLNLSGTAMADVSSVRVTLSDGDALTEDVTVDATGLTAGPGEKAWSAEFPRTPQFESLADGTLTATGAYELSAGGTTTGATRRIEKDTAKPGLATATPGGGLSNFTQHVSLNLPDNEEGAQIRYTVNGSDPGAASNLYGGQITVSDSQTIKARVFDKAGNPGDIAIFDYTIDRDAPGLSANLGTGSYNGTQSLKLSSPDQDASIHYTTNSDTPTKNSREYTGPINVPSTTTIKAVAIDPAGNASPVVERKITIRTATNTSLNVATTALKLGKSRTISGAVGPAQPGGKVTLTIRKPGFDVVRTLNLTGSRYSFTYRPPVLGNYSVQVSFAQDADSLASKSAVKNFRVIR